LRRAAEKGATNSRASSGRASPERATTGAAAGVGRLMPGGGERCRPGRLTRRAEFDAVYRNGRRRSSRQFTVFFAANGLSETRFGMSVGRAQGDAVVRNRIRRRVREMLRLHRGEIPSGWDLIVHPRASVAKGEFRLLSDELLGLVRNSLPPSFVPQSGERGGPGSGPNPEPGESRGGGPV